MVAPAPDSAPSDGLAPDATAPDDAALAVDAALFEAELEIDWLARLTPTGNLARWEAFRDSGYVRAPALTYRASDLDATALRRRLDGLPVQDVAHPVLGVLLTEKQAELRAQLRLLDAVGTPAFAPASVALFGGTDASLLADAREILRCVPGEPEEVEHVGAAALVDAARTARSAYASGTPDFHFEIDSVDDTDSVMAVHRGNLVIDAHARIPAARVAPLIAHEVDVHVLTRYNGRRQPLRLCESGFADYDVLQEGLATLAEYVAGCLPAARLRVLAARVVAADAVVRAEPLEAVFALLLDEHALGAEAAFDVAVRACRGGGLTKDAVYLAGLRELLAHLASGAELEPLFAGKFALGHRHEVRSLTEEGLLRPPALLPRFLLARGARERLAEARSTPVTHLYQPRPAA